MNSSTSPIRVAVIGGGPGGMFFCHAVHKLQEQQRQKRDTGDQNANGENDPHPSVSVEVTCFERDMAPGGIWKTAESATLANTNNGEKKDEREGGNISTRIYDELWTNGPSHSLEFHDYTWEEHFGSADPIPMYMPRKDIAEYLIGRVLKDNPTFFQDYFQFGTQVVDVVPLVDKEGQRTSGFQVTTQNLASGDTTEHVFDKVVWAAGENGKAIIPTDLQELFTQTNLETSARSTSVHKLLHSTQTHELKATIERQMNKTHVLLVGGSYSSEDLALQCVKWGAGQVSVTARSSDGAVSWMSNWPADKVKVHLNSRIKDVEKNESGSCNIVCEKVDFTWPNGYELCEYEDDEEIRIENVDVVVFCTGYKPNFSMLAECLRPACGSLPMDWMGSHETMFLSREGEDPTWLPKDWKMDDKHRVHSWTGDVPVKRGNYIRTTSCHPEIHRCIFLNNPDVMFLSECEFETPLLGLDVHAWMLASYATGAAPMPTVEELRQGNAQQLVDQMNNPAIRCSMDEEYAEVLDELPEGEGKFWPARDGSTEECTWYDCEVDEIEFQFRQLAQLMEEVKYPGVSFGTYEELSEAGKAQLDFAVNSAYTRECIEEALEKDPSKGSWFTFRDDERYSKDIYSLYTKTRARPLKKKWLDAVGGDCSVRHGDI